MYTHEMARPTDTMLLTEILDMETGLNIDLQVFLRRELSLVIKDRAELMARYARDPDVPWLVCQLCSAPVILVRTKDRYFHFRHHLNEEAETKCSISTRGELSADQIKCIKYNAAKESAAHLRLKAIIRDSLMADDKEMLEDLIAAAINDAVRRVEETSKERMASVTGGMQLPPGFKMPF